jgi:hypothetical protein
MGEVQGEDRGRYRGSIGEVGGRTGYVQEEGWEGTGGGSGEVVPQGGSAAVGPLRATDGL